MGILGDDNRTVINSPFAFPYSTVTTVDTIREQIRVDENGNVVNVVVPNLGTGILIAPNHVLTVAHVIRIGNDLRVTTSLEEDSLNSRNLTERSNFTPEDPAENAKNINVNYPTSTGFEWSSDVLDGDANFNEDIAILKTDNPLLSVNDTTWKVSRSKGN